MKTDLLAVTRRSMAAFSVAVLAMSGAGLLATSAHAQSRKDSVVLGMTLEPTSLDPTMAPAAAIGEVVHYNILEGLTKINVDGSVTRCWPKSGRWTRMARSTRSSCARA